MKKLLTLIFLSMIAFNAIHAEVTWTLSKDGTLTISGTNMPDYSTYSPWYSQRDKIKKVVIKNGVTKIGNYAFYSCSNLTSVTIPNSVMGIGYSAFYGCSGLTSITLPNSVTYIGDSAFEGCSSLTSITIPNSVTSIGNYAFHECTSLTSVTIPNSVTSIGGSAFSGCYILADKFVNNSICNCNYNVIDVEQKDGLLIKEKEVVQCRPWAVSVTIPNSVTSIGGAAFFGCSGLTSLTIPNSVTSIGGSAFKGCSRLTSIAIPNSVTYIGGSAFGDCYNLQSITIINPTPPSCGTSIFKCDTRYVRDTYDVYNYTTLHVPMGSKEVYSSAHEWRYFNNIKEDMEQNGKVFYAQLSVKQGTTGYTEQPVKADETYTIYIGTLGENKINAVTFNGEDVTDQVKDGYYTTPAIKAKSTLSISYEESNTTHVKEISNPELKVTGNEGEINISGIDNPANVEVYTTDGRLVETRGSVSGDTRIQVKEDELYLVKVGKRTIKIAM